VRVSPGYVPEVFVSVTAAWLARETPETVEVTNLVVVLVSETDKVADCPGVSPEIV
jgi:hypothetical protein